MRDWGGGGIVDRSNFFPLYIADLDLLLEHYKLVKLVKWY